MPEVACLNGIFSAPGNAVVSVEDRGFLFGDGIYEAMRSYRGRIWALDRHLVRLERSLSAIRIPLPVPGQLREQIHEAHRRSEVEDASIYVQITRGPGPRQHAFSDDLHPTTLILVRAIRIIPREERDRGVAAITWPDLRWERRDIKSINLLPNVLAKQAALEQGAFEALLYEPDGRVTEGASSNLFVVFGETVRTAPADHHILGGITRDLVISAAMREGIRVVQEPFSLNDLRNANELFLSGTVSEVLGVTQLDGHAVGHGAVGEITRRLSAAYLDCIQNERDCL